MKIIETHYSTIVITEVKDDPDNSLLHFRAIVNPGIDCARLITGYIHEGQLHVALGDYAPLNIGIATLECLHQHEREIVAGIQQSCLFFSYPHHTTDAKVSPCVEDEFTSLWKWQANHPGSTDEEFDAMLQQRGWTSDATISESLSELR